MSFPRYPEYKDSGVEGLGEVPSHWDVSSFRHCLSHMFNGLTATQVDEAENTVPVTRIETISFGVIDESKLGFINSDEARTDRALVPGDILFSNINSLNMVGKCAFYPGGRTIYAGMNLLVLRPATAKCDPLWLCWLVRSASFRDVVESLAKPAINQASVSQSSINSITVACPPLTEQTQIAAFLDRETATIDALVAEQQRLMELLKEKRQAVISHAVTRGLNSDAPLKPSGIEWLGDVPEHWEVKRLKYLGEAITGLTYSPADIVDDDTIGTLVLRSSNVQGGVITYDDNVYVSASIPRELVTQVGDILICSRNGSRALIGKNATIDDKSAGITFGAFMTVFRSLHSAYLSCILNSPLFEFQAGAFMTSTINQLTIGVLNNFEVPFPPEIERADIAAFLAIESAKFDTLAAEAQRAIDLLRERRTALISAAVTGQIDVRHVDA